MEVPIGSGSGYVWDLDGHIVTNFHVVHQAKSAQVAILTSSPKGDNNPITAKMAGDVTTLNPFTSVRPGALGSDGSTTLNGFTRSVYKAKVIGVDPTKGKFYMCYSLLSNIPVQSLLSTGFDCAPVTKILRS